jgi:hypothetical protein
MRNIIKHILKEEKESNLIKAIEDILYDLISVEHIDGALRYEEIYSVRLNTTDYADVLSSNPFNVTMLEEALDMRPYSVNYIDNELYDDIYLEKDNRNILYYIIIFISDVFKIKDRELRKSLRFKVEEVLNDMIKKYAEENNINLYEKHNLDW